MNLSKYVDPTRCFQLASGVLGIYLSYLVTGIIHQSMLKEKYQNDISKTQEQFTWPAGFLIFPCGITWIIGQIVNHFQIKEQERVKIPAKKSAICAFTVCVSTLTYTYAIYMTNFPVVMMFKSCNILSVILVGVLCSRVKDKKLKLGVKKIIVGVLVTIGIIMFKAFDPDLSKNETKTQFFGIVLLIVSLLADGFLPDFQAEIKSQFKPKPMEMMTEINKWVAIISFAYSCILFQIFPIFFFLFEHSKFVIHMLIMGVLSTFGQMFVYRMIKQFKQHFPPFVITTRKIFTVGLSIIYYRHATNVYQLIGIILVFGIVTYEFVSQLMDEKNKENISLETQGLSQSKAADLSVVDLEVEPPSRYQAMREEPFQEEIHNNQKKAYEKRVGSESNNENIQITAQQEVAEEPNESETKSATSS